MVATIPSHRVLWHWHRTPGLYLHYFPSCNVSDNTISVATNRCNFCWDCCSPDCYHFRSRLAMAPQLTPLSAWPSPGPNHRKHSTYDGWKARRRIRKMGYTIWCLLFLLAVLRMLRLFEGDINHVRIFGQPLVVLNSFEAARDLLEKRGAIYSGRPRLVLFSEMWVISLESYTITQLFWIQDGLGWCSSAPRSWSNVP